MLTVLLFISKLPDIPTRRQTWTRKTDTLHEALKTLAPLYLQWTQAVSHVAGLLGAEVEEKLII